ncbi:hypothetical protein E4V42_13585 [Clostridium estertheticum]|uniref:Uncharacterized protein n=1 Tax=Clostridium estertheticum TaxID=238834 RepID=A0A5N7J308_9CLOT|nr:hypothetical protein [Clostridium estertheticum]MPQ32462.1 hypothetical protein [Clostridium estertheticum]MPQ63121.1 hypothetical protein [Clostridium estertheticum]
MIISRNIGQVEMDLFKDLEAKISFTDLCQPAGTIEFNGYDGFLLNDILLFSFRYNNFIFEAKIRDGIVFVRRNELYQHSEQVLDSIGCTKVAIQWDIGSIGCGVIGPSSKGDMNCHMRSVKTPITTQPREIINILRKNNLLNNQIYSNISDLFLTVTDCIDFCEQDIRRYGAEKMFWDKGSGMDTLIPKREPDITIGIATFLNTYAALYNFDVNCETQVGNGSIDFTISATVKDIGIGRIAIEAKKADSNDLKKGLEKQLPEYMNRLRTDYGIYLVYWMKSYDYSFPQEETYAQLQINKLNAIQYVGNIRTLSINLSRQKSPSQL